MKFSDIYNSVASKYLLEQDEQQIQQQEQQPAETQQTIKSELPTEETIDLNEEKYKALLLMVQKALIIAFKDNPDARNRLADIEQLIDRDPKKAEDSLSSEMNLSTSEFPKPTI